METQLQILFMHPGSVEQINLWRTRTTIHAGHLRVNLFIFPIHSKYSRVNAFILGSRCNARALIYLFTEVQVLHIDLDLSYLFQFMYWAGVSIYVDSEFLPFLSHIS